MRLDPLTKSRNQHKEMNLKNKKIDKYHKKLDKMNKIKQKRKCSLNKLKLKLLEESISDSKRSRFEYLINRIGMNYVNACGMCRHIENKIVRMKK